MKHLHMAQTSPNHPQILSMEKKNMKLNESLHTDNSDGQNDSNTSSNGRATLKATIHGNQLIKFMPLNLSSIINLQHDISHPQLTISQPQKQCISQHHPHCI